MLQSCRVNLFDNLNDYSKSMVIVKNIKCASQKCNNGRHTEEGNNIKKETEGLNNIPTTHDILDRKGKWRGWREALKHSLYPCNCICGIQILEKQMFTRCLAYYLDSIVTIQKMLDLFLWTNNSNMQKE